MSTSQPSQQTTQTIQLSLRVPVEVAARIEILAREVATQRGTLAAALLSRAVDEIPAGRIRRDHLLEVLRDLAEKKSEAAP